VTDLHELPAQAADSGLWALLVMAGLHGLKADEAQVRHEHGGTAFDADTMILAARGIGMTARAVAQPVRRLPRTPLPAVARDRQGGFFILAKIDAGDQGGSFAPSGDQRAQQVLIQRQNAAPEVIEIGALLDLWDGTLILFTSAASLAGNMAKFDFSWFIPAIVKYRKVLIEILMVSLVLQLIGLVTPLFFQVVMDKVLVNEAMKTLEVIAIGLIAATGFEIVLTGLRTWTFAHTSSKLDVELGARLFRHLLGLPIAYFQARRVGDSVARVRELENIRAFLTGNAMTLVLDVIFSIVFMIVMLLYSPLLTLVVALSIPIYVAISLVFVPVIRARLNERFNLGAENQAFLVETVSGVDTLKTMALEPTWRRQWDKQLAGYVAASLRVTKATTLASNGINLVSKLVTVAIMWIGAGLVIQHQLTVGQLVAFNMLANQVSNPILRLAQLWNDFQQVGVSMERLADILNSRPEVEGAKSRLPRIEGAIEFDQVSFRYRPDASDVIRQLSLKIAPGEIIGIVGRSGSGKSTLTRLVQRLYVPDRGRILIDGQDIAIVDTASLRRQLGVVMQDNLLFNRSVRDNIALIDPTLPLERIIDAAKLAGAHEFICELPEGYDTMVGEHGTGLSGGQRQRIAIARALIGDPRILIFDEATSALDYESEQIIQRNMRDICKGRTVLIIAHRLSAVRIADRIVVMDRGQILEDGSHDELLATNGLYSRLWQMQWGAPSDLREALV